MKFTYTGPADAVEVVVRVKRGESIDVPADVAERLADQPETWSPDDSALEALTVDQLKDLAVERDVDLTGITKKADIVAAIEKGA